MQLSCSVYPESEERSKYFSKYCWTIAIVNCIVSTAKLKELFNLMFA